LEGKGGAASGPASAIDLPLGEEQTLKEQTIGEEQTRYAEQIRNRIAEAVPVQAWRKYCTSHGYEQKERGVDKLEKVIKKENVKLNRQVTRQCAVCSKAGAVRGCPCQARYYCGQVCQRQEWDAHKDSAEHLAWKQRE
jgi:hypothetical protein